MLWTLLLLLAMGLTSRSLSFTTGPEKHLDSYIDNNKTKERDFIQQLILAIRFTLSRKEVSLNNFAIRDKCLSGRWFHRLVRTYNFSRSKGILSPTFILQTFVSKHFMACSYNRWFFSFTSSTQAFLTIRRRFTKDGLFMDTSWGRIPV